MIFLLTLSGSCGILSKMSPGFAEDLLNFSALIFTISEEGSRIDAEGLLEPILAVLLLIVSLEMSLFGEEFFLIRPRLCLDKPLLDLFPVLRIIWLCRSSRQSRDSCRACWSDTSALVLGDEGVRRRLSLA